MELRHIEVDDLCLTAINMRHGKKTPDVSDILPSIVKRGIVVPLLVRSRDGYEVVAGRRRYFAAKAAAKQTGETVPLPCAVMESGDDAEAMECSILENVARVAPDEMTQFEAFVKLVDMGRSVAEIADTFGVTELLVSRRLALGNLIPKIREAFRQDDIDGNTVKHLTLASKAKQKEWFKLYEDPEQHAPMHYRLKQWLFGGQEISTAVAIFPLEEYTGSIVADLFGERSYFSDSETFWEMQNLAVAAMRDGYLAKGWSDVVVVDPTTHYYEYQHDKTSKKNGGRVYIDVTGSGEVECHVGFLSCLSPFNLED